MGSLSTTEKQEIILEKIKKVYELLGEKCKSKDEFITKVNNLFTSREKKYLDDKEVEKYYKSNLDLYYSKIQKEKKNTYLTPLSLNRDNASIYDYQQRYDEFLANLLKDHEEELMSIRLAAQIEEEDKIKENEEKLKKLYDEYKEKIKKMEEEAKNEKINLEKKQKEIEEKFQNKIELIKKQLQEERDEEKRIQLKEKNKALEEQKKKVELYKKEVNKFKKKQIEEIKNSFIQKENNFCMEEIKKFDKQKILSVIKKFLKEEQLIKFILKELKMNADIMKNSNKKVEHLNIILVGPSGEGKSTLINEVLNPKSDCITGFGKPQTKEIEYIESETVPFLRLADSQGIEKNEKLGVKAICNNIKNFITTQLENKDSDKYIHCIWYCWTGVRLEESEINVLKTLSEQYTLENLPVIIVYTKAIDPEEIKNAKKYISEELKLNNLFIEILAKEKKVNIGNKVETIKPFNLDLLRDKSIELAKGAIKSSWYQGLIEEIKEKIKKKINDIMVELKENIKKDIEKILENMKKNYDVNELYSQTVSIILNVLYKYSLLKPDVSIDNDEKLGITIGDNEFSFAHNSQSIIKEFVIEYFKSCFISYEKNLDNLLKKNTDDLYNEIMEFRDNFNENNDNNNLPYLEKKASLKKELNDNINYISKLAVLYNSFNNITNPLIEKIGEYFIELYNQGIKHKNFIEHATDIANISFEDIEKKIKEFNKKLTNGYEITNINQDAAPNDNLNNNTIQQDVNDLLNEIQ